MHWNKYRHICINTSTCFCCRMSKESESMLHSQEQLYYWAAMVRSLQLCAGGGINKVSLCRALLQRSVLCWQSIIKYIKYTRVPQKSRTNYPGSGEGVRGDEVQKQLRYGAKILYDAPAQSSPTSCYKMGHDPDHKLKVCVKKIFPKYFFSHFRKSLSRLFFLISLA